MPIELSQSQCRWIHNELYQGQVGWVFEAATAKALPQEPFRKNRP